MKTTWMSIGWEFMWIMHMQRMAKVMVLGGAYWRRSDLIFSGFLVLEEFVLGLMGPVQHLLAQAS
jgi:hypothetical protein